MRADAGEVSVPWSAGTAAYVMDALGLGFETACAPAEHLNLEPVLLATPALEPLTQRAISLEDVAFVRRRSLVGDLVGAHPGYRRRVRSDPGPKAPGSAGSLSR